MANKTLVVYYSWSATTATMAELVKNVTQSEVAELTVADEVFPSDMYATADIAKQQLATGQLPALTTVLPDLSQYDTIYVGGPVWGGQVATPVATFLSQLGQFKGTLVPFYTDAGTPGAYEADFKRQVAAAMTVKPGLGMTARQLQAVTQATQTIQAWA